MTDKLSSGPLPRAASQTLHELLEIFPVVVLTGARQTGKSTLAKNHPDTRNWPLLSLDLPATRARAESDPTEFVRSNKNLIIDEVQRVPQLLLAIKAEVDAEPHRTPGRFVLTGSANLLLMQKVADSLSGRAAYLRIGPMTRQELAGNATAGRWGELFSEDFETWIELLQSGDRSAVDWRDAVRTGGYPVPALAHNSAAAERWFTAYVQTYLERDLRELSQIENLSDFSNVMRALALRTGSIVNQTEIARDLGIVQRNISRWIELMETSWMLTRLQAYSVNRTSRLMKRPKIYWNDSALAMYLAREHEPQGAHLENFVLSDLLVWSSLQARPPQVMYWRTVDNAEVDFVIEHGKQLLAVEVKTTANPNPKDWVHLKRFVQEYSRDVHGALLLHGGTETFRVADRIIATPWWRVL